MTNQNRVFKYENNIDTDVIIPARYLDTSDPKELAKFCMKDIDEDFAKNVKPGDIIVALNNFGCGSSREHAPIAIKASNIKCVIAKSFARIFYRNAFNIGLPIIECSEACDNIDDEDFVDVDFEKGIIINHTKNEQYSYEPYPEFIQEIIKFNGLIGYTNEKLKQEGGR